MSDLFLDLRKHDRVVDFLQDTLEFADGNEREAAQKLVTVYQDGGHFSTTTLVEAARRLGKATWPARFALKRFISQEGAALEWQRVVASVRPSTAHLLERLQASLDTKNLHQVLEHPDSDMALGPSERSEIDAIHRSVHLDIWHEKHKALAVYLNDGEKELAAAIKRLNALRELAGDLPKAFQDEIFSKIERYEDHIFYQGQVVSLEILDDEIRYYTDQREISPLEI